MAQLVGTFNNRRLYSDKLFVSSIDMRVHFSDGSWIDMNTGEKHTFGVDDIKVDPPFDASATSSQQTTVGPTTFANAKELNIRNVPTSAIVVEAYDGTDISVTLEGTQIGVDTLTVKREGDTVYIYGAEDARGGSVNMRGVNISGSSINIGSGMSFVGGSVINSSFMGGKSIVITNSNSSSSPEVTITVKVPKGTAVAIAGTWITASVGDTDGAITIVSNGIGAITTGRVKNADITINGKADATLEEVSGNLSVKIAGTGNFRANGGNIDLLMATISGMGNASVRAKANSAVLKVSGMGNIYVSTVVNRPERKISGMGDIIVGNW